MKTFFRVRVNLFIALCLVLFQVHFSNAKEINKTFKNVSDIKIQTVSGDCSVEKSSNDEVKVTVTYTYDDRDFEAEFRQNGKKLYVAENFHGRNNRGRSTWKIQLPAGIDVDFSSASGDLELMDISGDMEGETASGDMTISGVSGDAHLSSASGDINAKDISGDVKISTASGDITLAKVSRETKLSTASGDIKIKGGSGEFRLSTASGDVKIGAGKGAFDISTASGDITCSGLEISDESEFKAASGDVEISLSKSPEGDIEISAASGDCELDYGDNKISGNITMTARNRRGYVEAPFEFDDEKIYHKGGREYVTKTAKRGDGPAVELNSASGSVTLAQK